MKTNNTHSSKNHRSKSRNYHGFTLVELIVVITILVILGTIAFVSLGNMSGSARDGVRITALNDIHKGLTISNIKTGSYPPPDDYMTIVGVSKQWYVGNSVMNAVKINGSAVDPLDKTRYMYTIDTTGKKIQLSAFLEESNTTLFSRTPSFINQTFASSTDYSNRHVYNFGERVGMLFNSISKAPVTETNSGSLDLTINTGSYTAIFSNSTASGTISGTGQNLLTNISIIQNSCVLGNIVVTNGWQVTAYNTLSVAYNQTCIPVQRTCNNGVFDGDTNYKYDTCSPTTALNCSATTQSGYTIPVINHTATQNITKNITGGIADINASCTNGTLSYGTENINCSTSWYVLQWGQCVLDECIGSAPAWSILNGTQKYNVSWNYSNTPWQCAFVCQAGYYWNGTTTCNAASAGYIVTSSGQTTQTACSSNAIYQDTTGQTACKTVSSGYYTTPIWTTPHTNQTQCEANSYCTVGVKTACAVGYSSPVGSTSVAACTINSYTVSGWFWTNANGATVSVCGSNVTADTSGNFTTTRNYGSVCNNITATRSGYNCSTTANGPASLAGNFTTVAGSCAVAAFVFNQTISVNTQNYNLKTAAIAAGWNQVLPLNATITVNAGVYITSISVGISAFDTGNGYPIGSTISVINNGYIVGKWGNGGIGGTFQSAAIASTAGGTWGPAFSTSTSINLTNNGTIGGGGGGGGGGGTGSQGGSLLVCGAGGGSGGVYAAWGGGGWWAGNGTAGAWGGTTSGYSGIFTIGNAGIVGTSSIGGSGWNSIIGQFFCYSATGGAGGAWGNLWSTGSSGTAGSPLIAGYTTAASPGWAAGAAINGNSYITWWATGTRLGIIQ